MAKLEIERLEIPSGQSFDLGVGWSIPDSGNFIGQQSSNLILTSTVDAADNAFLAIAGGGALSSSRGANVQVYGNEHASTGLLFLQSGSVSGGQVRIQAPASDGSIQLETNGSNRWTVDSSGHLVPNGANSYELGSLTNYVKTVWTDNIASPGDLTLGASTASGDIFFFLNGANRWVITAAGLLYPNSDASYSIGGSSNKINTIYSQIWACYNSTGNIWTNYANGSARLDFVSSASSGTYVHDIKNSSTGTAQLRVNNIAVNVPFTGVHVYQKASGETLENGDAVKLVNRELVKCTTANDQACIGLFTEHEITTEETEDSGGTTESIQDSFGTTYLRSVSAKTLYAVAACGDSVAHGLTGAKICDEGGAVVDGDLLVTSSTPGFLMKQSDDIVRAKTVAQCRETVTFDGNGQATGCYVYILK